jgi:hypothetical protein
MAFTIERKTQTEHVHRKDNGGQCQCEIALHGRYLDLIATARQAAPQPAATIEPNSATIFAVVGREKSAAKAEIIPAIIPSTAAMMFHVLRLTKYDLPRLGALAVTSYCLGRAPSKECGRCLLTKFGLAQFFTASLFWRFGEQWHLAVNLFDPRRRIRLRLAIRDQFTRPDMTHFLATHFSQQSRQPFVKTGGFTLAPQTMGFGGTHRRGCRTGGPSEERIRLRSDQESIQLRQLTFYG